MKELNGKKKFEETGETPDPEKEKNKEIKEVLTILRDQLKKDPKKWHKIANRIVGVSEETTTGVHRLYVMSKKK